MKKTKITSISVIAVIICAVLLLVFGSKRAPETPTVDNTGANTVTAYNTILKAIKNIDVLFADEMISLLDYHMVLKQSLELALPFLRKKVCQSRIRLRL